MVQQIKEQYASSKNLEAQSRKFRLVRDGEFHEYIIDMTDVPSWKGIISQLRLDPTDAAGNIEINYIRVAAP